MTSSIWKYVRLRYSVHLVRLSLVCALLPASHTPAVGQAAPADCPQGRISSIFVDNHSVFDTSDPDLDDRIGWAYRLANRLHVPTREAVIRREILLAEGDCFDPEMLLESERVLRASSFLAKVDIYGIPQPDGTYHVVIDTRDDWSVRLEPQTNSRDGLQLTGVELRDDNLLGYGKRVSAFYLREWDEPTYGFSYATPQLLGSRWDGSLAAGKTPTGHLFSQSLSYPFIGESGRWAMRQQLHHSDQFFDYLAESDSGLVRILFPEQRRSFDLGGVIRFGRRGSLTLLGAALAGEWIAYPSHPRFAQKEMEQTLAGDSLLRVPFGRDSVSSVRAMLLAGQRNVRYVRRRGFDTVRGTEDIRLGFEAEVGIGRSIAALSSHRDMALQLGLFGGAEIGTEITAGTQILLEGKRKSDEASERTAWNDVFAQMSGWAYWRPSPESRHTFIGALAAAGGWNTTVPFQLTLGGASALRGYPRQQDPGAQRVVVSLEQRSYWGWPYPHLFDLGTVAFVDVGRIWAGEVPYGIDSPVRANVGLGLRAALPPGSRNTFRLDLAVPIQSGLEAGDLVVSVGVGQVIGARRVRTDPQVQRSSRRGIATSLFTYPN
jgi:hypothetical protein